MSPERTPTPLNFRCPDCDRKLRLSGRLPEYVACPCGANWWLKPGDAFTDPGGLVVQREQVGDIVKEGKRTQADADVIGATLVATMTKQVESCGLTAELYRRYERDCLAFALVPLPAPERFPRIEAARREPMSFDRGELLALRSAIRLSVEKNERGWWPDDGGHPSRSFRIAAGRTLEHRINAALRRMEDGATTGPPPLPEAQTPPD